MKPGERTRRKGVEQRFGLWRWCGAGIAAFAVGLGWAAQAALVRSMQPPCQRAGWRHSHAAAPRLVSGRREGQVRAAASGRAARRGLRLAGGLGRGCGRAIISERGSVRWCRGRGDGGRRSRSAEWGCCSWGCLNCSAPRSPRGPRPWRRVWAGCERGAVTPVPCCSPAGRAALLERAFAGKGQWMAATARAVAGLARQAGKGSRASASPTSTDPRRGELIPPVPTLTRCPSLPVQITRPAPTLPVPSSRRWLLRHLERTMPLPFARAIYTSEAQGEKIRSPTHGIQRATSNGTAEEDSQSPSSQQALGHPPHPGCPAKPLQH